jgi:hypothetical protein
MPVANVIKFDFSLALKEEAQEVLLGLGEDEESAE